MGDGVDGAVLFEDVAAPGGVNGRIQESGVRIQKCLFKVLALRGIETPEC
jgi:hypothetical protein